MIARSLYCCVAVRWLYLKSFVCGEVIQIEAFCRFVKSLSFPIVSDIFHLHPRSLIVLLCFSEYGYELRLENCWVMDFHPSRISIPYMPKFCNIDIIYQMGQNQSTETGSKAQEGNNISVGTTFEQSQVPGDSTIVCCHSLNGVELSGNTKFPYVDDMLMSDNVRNT